MHQLETVQRIAAPERSALYADYLAQRRPVVVRGLFAAQPVAAIASLGDVRARLGEVEIGVTEQYFAAFVRTGLMDPRARRPLEWMPVGAYLDLVDRDPATTQVCSELPVPEAVAALFDPPEICDLHYDAESGIRAHMFLGRAGSTAQLHFDGDLQHVLLHQVVGRKRVTLFDPRAAGALEPLLHWGLVRLDAMSADDRAGFVRAAGGVDVVIGPGETLYVPPLLWHHVDYLDTAFGFSLRFGRDPRFAPLRSGVPNATLQAVVAELMRRPPSEVVEQAVRALTAAATAPYRTAREWYDRREAVLHELHARLCPHDALPATPARHRDLFDRNLDRQLQLLNPASAS